jgi:hypothetical protein
MEQVMTEQVDKLREQMTNVNTVPMPETLEELQEAANAWFGPMMARGGFFQSRKAW